VSNIVFDRELTEAENVRIADILSDYPLIEPEPASLDRISAMVMDSQSTADKYSQIQTGLDDIAMGLMSFLPDSSGHIGPMLKTLLYTYGVTLYRLAISDTIPSGQLYGADQYISLATSIDNQYHQAYNMLGDIWLWIPEKAEKSIRYYKTALHYYGGPIYSNFASEDSKDNFIGDNYLKIALNLTRLHRLNDAELFFAHAYKLIDSYYGGFSDFNFDGWVGVQEYYLSVES
jgi:hypothetical protein